VRGEGERHVWMATGTLPAGKKPTDPYPRGNSQTRTRTRNPRRVKNSARTRYPRVLYARGYTRVCNVPNRQRAAGVPGPPHAAPF
jgi:hypothetical protein